LPAGHGGVYQSPVIADPTFYALAIPAFPSSAIWPSAISAKAGSA
jgi:hypothetical protein